MRRELVAVTAAVFCAGALTAAQNAGAQGQQSNPDQSRETRATPSAQANQMATLTGCVYREQDVPGRTPNVAERVGILEDYILAEVSTGGQAQAAAGAGATDRPGAAAPSGATASAGAAPGQPGATTGQAGQPGQRDTAGTTGTQARGAQHPMYKLEHEDDDKLQALVGKRVEVMGRIDAEAGDSQAGAAAGAKPAEDKSVGPDRIELPEFEITSIREIAGTCPASPSAR